MHGGRFFFCSHKGRLFLPARGGFPRFLLPAIVLECSAHNERADVVLGGAFTLALGGFLQFFLRCSRLQPDCKEGLKETLGLYIKERLR